MDEDERERAKRHAGERAAGAVEDGQVVGLGTGSTAAHAIRAIGRRVEDGLSVRGVPTSFQSRQLAVESGIELVGLDEAEGVDLAIDGADQAAGADLVKGGGAAHAREKAVDAAADRLLVVVDPTKVVDVLSEPVPVEVLPDARVPVARAVRERGGEPTLRSAAGKDGPVVTDNGNLVLDCDFGRIDDPADLAAWCSALPGVLEHGLFVDMADELHLGQPDGVEVREL
ncbi:ribose 5-phosphate isomerase A [Halobacteriales archaeon QS_8_69_26]|nr:MAG: ribose 5-phosphate isomerase A [Halobacteriales archaeon QS_8_69_26]